MINYLVLEVGKWCFDYYLGWGFYFVRGGIGCLYDYCCLWNIVIVWNGGGSFIEVDY